ncbi:MAG: hypothetical protein WD068_02085 [Candidatus Babeliales bacterium]
MKRLMRVFSLVCVSSLAWAGVQVHFDEHLSDEARHCIYSALDEHQLNHKKFPTSAHLMQQCPAIQDVSMHQVLPDEIDVTITSYKPHVCLNEIYVVTKDGKIFNASLFKDAQALPCMQTKNSNSDISAYCKDFLMKLPNDILEECNIEWESGTKIILRDKKQPFFAIVCKASTAINELQYELCKNIKKGLEQRGDLGDKPITQWNADIRFDKQIILSKDRGHRYVESF